MCGLFIPLKEYSNTVLMGIKQPDHMKNYFFRFLLFFLTAEFQPMRGD